MRKKPEQDQFCDVAVPLQCSPWYELLSNISKANYKDRLPEKRLPHWDTNFALLYTLLHYVLLSQCSEHKVNGMLCT